MQLIVNSQNKEGGWRYNPKKEDADISVTVCQVMALRAAHNAGIHVPKETIDRAVEFVKKCQNRDGGFCYMLSVGGESGFPRSAAAIVALNSAGIYQGPEITKGLDYLTRFRPEQGVTRREEYFEYGHYYAVQAMWQAGGERWARWYPAVRDELLARQGPSGSWSPGLRIRICHGHVPHHPANAGEPIADLPAIDVTPLARLLYPAGWERGRG